MSALGTSISSVLEILLVIALGFYLRSKGKLSDDFKTNISFLIMNIALPLSIFVSVLTHLNRGKLAGLSMGLIYVGISFLAGYMVAWSIIKIFKIRRGRRGAFINMAVNANTIFIGLPLTIALFGEESMSYFLLYYVANTVSTWAIGVFFISSDDPTEDSRPGKAKRKLNWRKLFPAPLIGLIVALIWLLTGLPLPNLINNTFTMVGNLVTPLALIYIGIILSDAGLKSIHIDKDTVLGLLARFIIAPAIMIAVFTFLKYSGNHTSSLESSTLIVQSAAPGLAVLPLLVGESHGDVSYATNLVTTSTLMFIIIIPILMVLISFI